MKPIYDILTAIADRHLAIPTLLERRNDSLDFHEVSVWGVKDALWYAYRAGVSASAQSGDRAEWIDPVRYAHTWVRTAREVLAQPGRTAMVDHLLELGLSQIAAALATVETADPAAATGNKPYSVLLLYPDYANDSGAETYYAFVDASDELEAVAVAQRQAVAAQEGVEIAPDAFAPLLVTQGHHHSEALFNK
jgi:hypothetical protein